MIWRNRQADCSDATAKRAGRTTLTGCVLLAALVLHVFGITLPAGDARAQGPGLYKDGEKVLGFEESLIISSDSLQKLSAAPPSKGREFRRQVLGTENPDQSREQKQYFRTVVTCRDIIIGHVADENLQPASGSDVDRLLALRSDLELAGEWLAAKYDRVGSDIADLGYPPDKLALHAQVAEGHRLASRRLLDLLSDLGEAKAAGSEVGIDRVIEELRVYFQDHVFRQDPPLMNSGPRPALMDIRPPLTVQRDQTAKQPAPAYPPAMTQEAAFDPADLNPTIDVQFTADITTLASDLSHSAPTIYEYVHNNFTFEPYLGSRKGSQQTLNHRRGNDYDQASLLIALLRVSGIPARYATGTVEMPIDRATSWLGIDDPFNAGSILTTAGMEGVLVTLGMDPVAIRCKRVWVEAWVPFQNYRGAVNDSTGFRWVPLDPAFKQYNTTSAINLPAEIGFDAEAFVQDYYSTMHAETPIELFEQMLLDSLAVRYPGSDLEDLIRTRSVVAETDGILPGTLPYEVLSFDGTFSEIPSNKRYYIRFHLSGGGTDLDYTTSVPEIVEKQVTISYVGATPADQEIIDTAGGIFNVDLPYLVHLFPVLKIDGCEVARGIGSVMMGVTHSSDMHFTVPTGAQNVVPAVFNLIIAGNYQGIGIDTEDAFPAFFDVPETACAEEYLSQVVHQTSLTYLNNVDLADDNVADLMHLVVLNDVSEAIVENTVTVLFDGCGNPVTFDWTGMIVDADRKILGPFSVDGLDNSCDFMRLGGADGSIQENRLFETVFDEEAISTIKILELASDSLIAICEITTSISADCPGLNQPAHVDSAINAALALGHHVIIPEREFTYYDWTGTGWIDLDPSSCAAGYIISGGHNGGETVQDWSAQLRNMLTQGTICIRPEGTIPDDDILVSPGPDAGTNIYCADNTNNWTFTVPTIIGKDKDCAETDRLINKTFTVTNFTIKQLAEHPKFGPGEYVFRIGSPPSSGCGCRIMEKTVRIVKLVMDHDVWWFNGENPGGGYHIQSTLTASGVTSGTFRWQVTAGSGKIDLNNGGGDSDDITATNDNTITIKSTAPSAGATSVTKDITIKLSVDGVGGCNFGTVVFAPDHFRHIGNADEPYGGGYVSLIVYSIRDQFDRILPYEVPWNEDIDANGAQSSAGTVASAATSDWTIANGRPQNENWPWGQEDGWNVPPTQAYDGISRPVIPGILPTAQNPQSPRGSDKIDHSPKGAWYVGSKIITKGVKMIEVVWQTYRDHARHE